MRVLFLFVDGVGVGADVPGVNPLASLEMPNLWSVLGGRPILDRSGDGGSAATLSLDAVMGVAGLPQSATGQAALLTGANAPRLEGGHVGPYPTASLRDLLARRGLFKVAADLGHTVALANAYPDRYLDRAGRGTARMGAIARAAWLAGVRFRGPEDLRRGRAVSASLSNGPWRERLGYPDLPDVGPGDAGAILADVAAQHRLTVFETYLTDVAGHRQDLSMALSVLADLDEFVGGLAARLPTDTALVIASDHGNVEDLTTRRHTTNRAVVAWHAPGPRPRLEALTDVAPAILAALGRRPPLPPVPASGR